MLEVQSAQHLSEGLHQGRSCSYELMHLQIMDLPSPACTHISAAYLGYEEAEVSKAMEPPRVVVAPLQTNHGLDLCKSKPAGAHT